MYWFSVQLSPIGLRPGYAICMLTARLRFARPPAAVHKTRQQCLCRALMLSVRVLGRPRDWGLVQRTLSMSLSSFDHIEESSLISHIVLLANHIRQTSKTSPRPRKTQRTQASTTKPSKRMIWGLTFNTTPAKISLAHVSFKVVNPTFRLAKESSRLDISRFVRHICVYV